ncbi:MAG: hypothetical protein ACKVPX_05130 [Myxococcaceae bacterium]
MMNLWGLTVYLALAQVAAPWKSTDAEVAKKALEETVVCGDARGHLVAIAPHERQGYQLFIGSVSRLIPVRLPPWVLSGTSFLDPRFERPSANSDFRGVDMRVYSEVNWDADKKRCTATCGEREVQLKRLPADQAKRVLMSAKLEENPQAYLPHALLRDDTGRYFLVQKGARASNARSFQLFVGIKGQMTEQKMLNVVADSEGEIFSTRAGELRLVVDQKGTSLWIEQAQKTPLRNVPLEQNLPLIYNELGVYTGARLGTPCDDL